MKPIISQFAFFSAIGAVGTVVHFSLLILLVQGRGVSPVIASFSGFVLGASINYWLNYHITFKSNNPHIFGFAKYFLVSLIGLFFNILIMAAATPWLHYLIAQVITTGLVLVWNFLCSRYWAFRGEFHGNT